MTTSTSSEDESAALYRGLAEAVPAMVFSAQPDGSLDYVNQRWIDYTGLTFEQSIGFTWAPLVHPDDVEATVAAWLTTVETKREHEAAYRLRRVDGVYRWHVTRAVPMIGPDGAITRWFGTTVDIDEPRRTADRLAFLVAAGSVLSGSLDYATTLANVTRLVVTHVATFCFVDLLREDGSIERVAWAHADERWAERMATCTRFTPVAGGPGSIPTAIATGAPVVLTHVDDAVRRASAMNDEHLAFMRDLAYTSLVVVPIVTSGVVLGALTMGATAAAGRTPDDADVATAQELGRRAGLAVENARSFAAEQRATQRLRFVADAGKVLGRSLELGETLDALLDLVVPTMGDGVVINLRDDDGRLRVVAIRHADPAHAETIARLRGSSYSNERADAGSAYVMRTEIPQIIADIDDGFVTTAIKAGAQTAIRNLGLHSTIIVPLISRGRAIGTLAAAWATGGRRYTNADMPLFEDLAGRAAVAIENAQLYAREHNVATAMQQAALPRSLPVVAGASFDAVYRPGKIEAQIGGDWYDAFALPDGRIVISIGDVLGSGLAAAIAMAKIREAIRAAALADPDPAAIVAVAHAALVLDDPEKLATAVVAVLDPRARTLACVAAGHPGPLLRAADGTISEPFLVRGLPLGLRNGERAAAQTIALASPSFLVFYTDGLVESTRDMLEGERRLRAAIADPAIAGAPRPADAIYAAVLFDGAHDDVAILTLSHH